MDLLGSSTRFARSLSFASAHISGNEAVVYHERSERSERGRMVPTERIELSWDCSHTLLKRARLPIPPRRLGTEGVYGERIFVQ